VINNKGGTGKTTTTVNLGATLSSSLGHRVLLVDLDAQGSASSHLGCNSGDDILTSADVLFHDLPAEAAVAPSDVQGLDLMPGGIELAHSDLVLADMPFREERLKKALDPLRSEYDFILIDCAPSLSLLPVNALLAADGFLVPLLPEPLSVDGLLGLLGAVERIEQGMGVSLQLMGIVFNNVLLGRFARFRAEAKAQQVIMDSVRGRFGDDVLETVIRRDGAITSSPSKGRTLSEESSNSPGGRDYLSLARELIERTGTLSNGVLQSP
jgi:chromosome partitioning protein